MKKLFLILLVGTFVLSFASAVDWKIQDGSFETVITFSDSGSVNTTSWIAENGVKLSETYVAITSLSTCDAGEYLSYDGADFSCSTPSLDIEHASVTIDGANITTGTIDFARLPDLTDSHTLDYHNVTGIPTCDAGDVLTYDGTDLSCTTPDSSMDYTNIAMTNQTNTFSQNQILSSGMNVTGYIELETSSSGIKRGSTSITIDDSGNVITVLGGV
jgi:hypothetical protein